jgi:hypothetical protein
MEQFLQPRAVRQQGYNGLLLLLVERCCNDRPRCTKAEYQAGFAQYDAWKAEQEAAQATAKAAAEAKLAALGLTADDLKALGLGGN